MVADDFHMRQRRVLHREYSISLRHLCVDLVAVVAISTNMFMMTKAALMTTVAAQPNGLHACPPSQGSRARSGPRPHHCLWRKAGSGGLARRLFLRGGRNGADSLGDPDRGAETDMTLAEILDAAAADAEACGDKGDTIGGAKPPDGIDLEYEYRRLLVEVEALRQELKARSGQEEEESVIRAARMRRPESSAGGMEEAACCAVTRSAKGQRKSCC